MVTLSWIQYAVERDTGKTGKHRWRQRSHTGFKHRCICILILHMCRTKKCSNLTAEQKFMSHVFDLVVKVMISQTLSDSHSSFSRFLNTSLVTGFFLYERMKRVKWHRHNWGRASFCALYTLDALLASHGLQSILKRFDLYFLCFKTGPYQ